MDKTDIPASCCIDGAGVEPKNCSLASAVVHQGCYNKFLSFVKSHAMQLGGVGLGIAFVQVIITSLFGTDSGIHLKSDKIFEKALFKIYIFQNTKYRPY